MHFSNYCWLASLLPALGKAGNNLRTKWDLAQACRCCNIPLMVLENGIPEKGVFVPHYLVVISIALARFFLLQLYLYLCIQSCV